MPAQRADAKRNVDALLAAAKEVFAERGVAVPAKEITDRAGVGVGTLYRHFPQRSDLIVAVLQNEMAACVAAAGELAGHEPWEAVTGFVDVFSAFVGTKQGLAEALHSGDPAYDGLPGQIFPRLVEAFEPLLQRAVEAGLARGDVTAREALSTVSLLLRSPADLGPRMVQVFTEGLRRKD